MTTDQTPAFRVDPDDVVKALRATHPDLVAAAEWKVAALRTKAERDQARARVAELEAERTTSAPESA